MELRITTVFTLLVLSAGAAFSDDPGTLGKSIQPVSPAERWAKALQSLAHGKPANGRGPSHPIPQKDQDNSTLPHWNGKFESNEKHFSFTMVGTDPSKGSATTVIDTAIIPYKLHFLSNGSVFDASKDMLDGKTPLVGAVNSPVFENVTFTANSTNLGTTQFGDAVQRANFWKDVSTHSPGYHVLLSHPHVLPLQVVDVPADKGVTQKDKSTGRLVGFVDLVWLDHLLVETMVELDIEPTTLAIHQFGEIVGVGLNGGGALGYHNAVDFTGNQFKIQGAVTYIFSDWFSNEAFGNAPGIGNTGTLGHEIAEWLNDPFVGNVVPFWQDPGTPKFCEQDFLEVGDPLENMNYFTAQSDGFTYVLPDVAFLPWFARQSPSTSVNGWYSFRNQLPGFSRFCPEFSDFTPSAFDFPGATSTVLSSINNHQHIAGFYDDGSGGTHSFIFDGKDFTPVKVPGSHIVAANKINDQGEVVGAFIDGSKNQHGFIWTNGQATTIDFPGAAGTSLVGLNNGPNPDIVGFYLDNGGHAHGFRLTNNHFQSITLPPEKDVFVNGINDGGQMAGGADDGKLIDSVGFVGTQGHFVQLSFPSAFSTTATVANSLNNAAQVVGSFFDFATHGFLEIGGLYAQVDGGLDFDGALVTVLNDNNNAGVMVGAFQDLTGIHGFIATPIGN